MGIHSNEAEEMFVWEPPQPLTRKAVVDRIQELESQFYPQYEPIMERFLERRFLDLRKYASLDDSLIAEGITLSTKVTRTGHGVQVLSAGDLVSERTIRNFRERYHKMVKVPQFTSNCLLLIKSYQEWLTYSLSKRFRSITTEKQHQWAEKVVTIAFIRYTLEQKRHWNNFADPAVAARINLPSLHRILLEQASHYVQRSIKSPELKQAFLNDYRPLLSGCIQQLCSDWEPLPPLPEDIPHLYRFLFEEQKDEKGKSR